MRHLGFAVILAFTAAGSDVRVKLEPRKSVGPPKRADRASISVTSNLVVVPVTVLDAKGAPVVGLPRERFRLFEDGVEQTIQGFGQEDAPVSIGIVFDASRSMENKLDQARDAVASLFNDALPEDEFHLVEFNDSPRLMCDLTTDTAEVRRALDAVRAQGWTALFDGIFMSAHRMRKAHHPRRALVILSDGEDNFSRYGEGELRSYLREAGVVVYSIALTSGAPVDHDTRHLRRLTRETGGWAYSVGKLDRMADTVRAIGTAIRSQYFLSYTPSNPRHDGKFRKIGVQLAAEKNSGLAASWRSGYYAADSR
jgi:Ca-activated chloride channel family protein